MHSMIFAIFVIVISFCEVVCEVDTINEISGNVVVGANIYKCKCNMDEALRNGECIPSSNPIPVWDSVKQRDFIVDISNFSSIAVNPVQCQEGFSKISLNISHFVIYTNGLLDNLVLIDQSPTPYYCVDHVLQEGGITLVAEVCQANPTIPVCCPPGFVSNLNQDCVMENAPFNPPLIGGFPWMQYNVTEQSIKCEEGKVLKMERLTLPHEIGASLVSYPLGTKLQWNSPYSLSPYFVSYDEYCVRVTQSSHGWLYLAQFCIPDPKLEHIETCENSICLRKCCPPGYIYDKIYSTCIQDFNHTIKYMFIESNGQQTSEPKNLTVIFGTPFCEETRIYFDESGMLKFYSDGSLVTSKKEKYSSLHYCIDGVTSNYTDPNRTVTDSAIICFKELKVMCQWRWVIGGVLLGISCVFYVLTLVVYLSIDALRSKMVGKCLISQVSALLIAYLTLIFMQNTENYNYSELTCNFPGTVEHIAILASFFWLNVMCYDMWSKIRKMRVSSHKVKSSKKFILYCIYAWGTPMMIAAIRVIIDHIPESEDNQWLVRSNMGKSHCFFTGNYSSAKWLYLYGPILALLLVNLTFFIHVAIVIVRTKKETERILAGASSNKGKKSITAKKEKALLYLKLFLVMGISWLMEIIMWVAVSESDCSFWGFDIVNMFQGVFIFIIFVCKKTTLKAVKERFSFRRPRKGEEYCLTEPEKANREVQNIVAHDTS